MLRAGIKVHAWTSFATQLDAGGHRTREAPRPPPTAGSNAPRLRCNHRPRCVAKRGIGAERPGPRSWTPPGRRPRRSRGCTTRRRRSWT